MATMVDINESLMDYNFKVFLEPVRDLVLPETRSNALIHETQLHVDCRKDACMKLIGIDSIFIP